MSTSTSAANVDLYPFIVSSEHRLLVCRDHKCQHAVWPNAVVSHLHDKHGIPHGSQRSRALYLAIDTLVESGQLAEKVSQLGSIPLLVKPVPHVQLIRDGLKCPHPGCVKVYGCIESLRKHKRVAHRPSTVPGRQTAASKAASEPNYFTVLCQRLFPTRSFSHYIEVLSDTSSASTLIESVDLPSSPDINPATIWQSIRTEAESSFSLSRDRTIATLQLGEEGGAEWVKYARLQEYVQDHEIKRIVVLMDKPDKRHEPQLWEVWSGFDRMYLVIRRNFPTYGRNVRGLANQVEPNPISQDKPLEPYWKPEAAPYTLAWKQICMWFGRTYDPDAKRSADGVPYYRFNLEQHECWMALFRPTSTVVGDTDTIEDVDSEDDPVANSDANHMEDIGLSFDQEGSTLLGAGISDGCGSDTASAHSSESEAEDDYDDDSVDLFAPLETMGDVERKCHAFCMSLIKQNKQSEELLCPLVGAATLLALRMTGLEAVSRFKTKLSTVARLSRMFTLEHAVMRRGRNDCYSYMQKLVKTFIVLGTGGFMHWSRTLVSLLTSVSNNSHVGHSIAWDGEDATYKQGRLSLHGLTKVIHGHLVEATKQLHEVVLFNIELPPIPWDRLRDDVTHKSPLENFLNLSLSAEELNIDVFKSSTAALGLLNGMRGQVAWMKEVEKFREQLLLLVHLTSGSPARAQELLRLTFRNCSETAGRSVFWLDGHVALVTSFHLTKCTKSRVKVIYRFLPDQVGALLIQYLWLVLPTYELLLSRQQTGNPRLSSRLWSRGVHGHNWTTTRMSTLMSSLFRRLTSQRIIVSEYRHLAKAIGRKYLCDFFDDDLLDEEAMDKDFETNAIDMQFGHTTKTSWTRYAMLAALNMAGSTELHKEKFLNGSRAWHRLTGFKRLHPHHDSFLEAVTVFDKHSTRKWQAKFHERLEQADIEREFRTLYGEHARLRAGQAQYLSTVFKGHPAVLIVAPTGSGKTVSFLLAAFCARGTLTVVIVPFVPLRANLAERCSIGGLRAREWSEGSPADDADVVFVTPEGMATDSFRSFISRMVACGKLYRIVVDEVHELLTSGKNFRPAFMEIRRLIKHNVRMLMLTATLPPVVEQEVFTEVGLESTEVQVHRSSSSRSNISYCVRNLDDMRAGSREYLDLSPVDMALRCINSTLENASHRGRVMIFCNFRETAEEVAKTLNCGLCISEDRTRQQRALATERRREQDIKTFLEDSQGVIAGTSCLGTGFDVPGVHHIFSLGLPRSLIETAQMSGRGARDGGICLVSILTSRSLNHQSSREMDRTAMKELETTKFCRRRVLDTFLDGQTYRDTCEADEEPCDICFHTFDIKPINLHRYEAVVGTERRTQCSLNTPSGLNRTELGSKRALTSLDDMIPATKRHCNASPSIQEQCTPSNSSGLPSSTLKPNGSPDTFLQTSASTPATSVVPSSGSMSERRAQYGLGFSSPTTDRGKSVGKQPQKPTKGASNTAITESDDELHVGNEAFARQEVAMLQSANRCREEDASVEAMIQRIRDIRARYARECVACVLSNVHPTDHLVTDCQNPLYQAIWKEKNKISMKIKYPNFGACWICGLPQSTCQEGWRQRRRDGDLLSASAAGFEAIKKCPNKWLGVCFIYGVLSVRPEINSAWTDRLRRQGVDRSEPEEVRKYLAIFLKKDWTEFTQLAVEFDWIARQIGWA